MEHYMSKLILHASYKCVYMILWIRFMTYVFNHLFKQDDMAGGKWLNLFLKRHERLSIRRPELLLQELLDLIRKSLENFLIM